VLYRLRSEQRLSIAPEMELDRCRVSAASPAAYSSSAARAGPQETAILLAFLQTASRLSNPWV
jgi:hypothetical protein